MSCCQIFLYSFRLSFLLGFRDLRSFRMIPREREYFLRVNVFFDKWLQSQCHLHPHHLPGCALVALLDLVPTLEGFFKLGYGQTGKSVKTHTHGAKRESQQVVDA